MAQDYSLPRFLEETESDGSPAAVRSQKILPEMEKS